MKIKTAMSIHNKYDLVLIDTLNNRIKKKVSTTNMLTNGFYYSFSTFAALVYCSIGTGTGEVQATDKNLFKHLYKVSLSKDTEIIRCTNQELSLLLTFEFPASTSCVGKITELGLSIYNNNTGGYPFVSHALLKDAEGHPISIDKTDTDKLIISVQFNVSLPEKSNGFNFGIIENLPFTFEALHDNKKSLCKDSSDSVYYCTSFINGQYSGVSTSPNKTVNYSNKSVKISNNRLGTAYGNGKYINYIVFSGFGFVKFPNAEIMPNVPITGLPVGTGDGVTKSFKNPIPLFVKDTDKVYVNGALQVRGVDYTIDYKANLDLAAEVTPGNFIKNMYGGDVGPSPFYNSVPRVPFGTSVAMADQFMSYCTGTYRYLTGDKPLIIELDSDCISLDINGIRLEGMLLYLRNRGTTNIPNLELVVSYSNDKTSFTEVCRIDAHTSNLSSGNTFDTVNAKYWKLELDFSRVEDDKKANISDIIYACTSNEYSNLLYYRGQPITFKNPPAEGAVITMDCEIDRPYKTENWVLDFNPEFQY